MAQQKGLAVDVDALVQALAVRHPTLHLVPGVRGRTLCGSFRIEHEGEEIDWFAVQIRLAELDRGELPVVRETAGRIPWTAERHVNSDGTCCVCLPEDYFISHPGAFDLLAFLDGPLRSFFIAQALVERGEPWPHGEWRHGEHGRLDWFRSFLAGLSPDRARAYLTLLGLRELRGHHRCACGGGLPLRRCHYALLQRMRGYCPPSKMSVLADRARGT